MAPQRRPIEAALSFFGRHALTVNAASGKLKGTRRGVLRETAKRPQHILGLARFCRGLSCKSASGF